MTECGIARGPARKTTPAVEATVVGMVAQMLAEAMRERHGGRYGSLAQFVEASSLRDNVKVTLEGVTFTPARSSLDFLVAFKGEGAVAERQWRTLNARWRRSPYEYETAPIGESESIVRAITPWKKARQWVAEYLGEAFEKMLPLALAAPVTPEGPLSLAAVRLLAGKMASRQGGMVPVEPLRAVVAAAPGWAWSEGVAGVQVSEQDEQRHPALKAIDALPRVNMRVSPGRIVVYHYDRDLTDDDLPAILGAFRHAGDAARTDGFVDDAPGALLYASASLVLDSPKKNIGAGWDRWVLVIEGARVATPAYAVTDPLGRSLFLPRPGVLYPRARRVPPRSRNGRRPVAEAPEVELLDGATFWPRVYDLGLGALGDAMLSSYGQDELSRLMYRMRVSSFGGTGECQLCANVQKLRPRSGHLFLVDHGYHYPDSLGYRGGELGQREGSCEGVDHKPYEKSCDLLKIVVKREAAMLERAERALEDARKVRAGRSDLVLPARWVDREAKDGAPMVTVKHGSDGWKRWADFLVARANDAFLGARDYVRWLQRRIDTWEPRPLYDELDAAEKAAFVGAEGGS